MTASSFAGLGLVARISGAAAAVQASGGLVAAYSFDEGAGTTVRDASGNNNTGSVANASFVAGKFGQALNFNGSSSIVRIPDRASLDLTRAMTLEAWVKPTTVAGWQTILMKENAGDLSYAMYGNSDSDGGLGLYVRGSGVTQQLNRSTSARLAANSWVHVVATYDGTTMRLYRNGALRTSKAVAISADVSAGQLAIGGNSVWGEYFDGAIDNVRIYNRALSGAEVLANRDAAVVSPSTPVTTGNTVTTTAPPVTTTAPPVTTTAPPVTTTQPPVTTTAPPVTTTQPPATGGVQPPMAAPAGTSWKLAFNEDFTSNTLDLNKWTPCFSWAWSYDGCTQSFNNGREQYLPSQVQINNGVASLVAQPQASNGGKDYRSGLLSTTNRPMSTSNPNSLYKFRYGYVEGRMKLPREKGMFSAFWMMPPSYNNWNYAYEVDIFETLGSTDKTTWMHVHHTNRTIPWDPNGGGGNGACPTHDYADGFHTYGVNWQPTFIEFYIDGKSCGKFTGPVWNGDLEVIINLMVDVDWQKQWGIAGATTTGRMDIDYVKVWQAG